jgi:ribosomal protein L11 methyltransferase
MSYAQWQGSVPELLRVGRFRLVPPWIGAPEGLPADPGAETRNILLDPGVVFGNGTHPTTLHCLEALEVAFAEGRIDSVLDLGTGTGVLALGAARLGARRVVAVDNNLLSVQTARANIVRNGLTRQVIAVQGRAEDFIACRADLLVANLHDDVLGYLLGAPGFLSQKRFVLSGLLRSPAREVRHRLGRLPVRLLREWSCEGIWHTYYGTITARGGTVMPVADPKG